LCDINGAVELLPAWLNSGQAEWIDTAERELRH
jgi:hypothetical protein